MCWADKTALAVFLAIMAFWAFICGTGGGFTPNNVHTLFWDIGWRMFLFAGLPLWLVLRFIDLLIGGPQKRSGVVTGRWE